MAGRPASTLTRARIELIQAQRDGQELKNAQLRGELVTIEEVEQRWSDILRVMRAGLLALPSRVAQRLPHLTRGDKAAIESDQFSKSSPRLDLKRVPAVLRPPPRLPLSHWIEANLRL